MGEYAAFIWSAYAVAAVVVAGLSLQIWRDMRRQQALLDELEARGAPRRRGPHRAEGTAGRSGN
jgi:heme exporter protein D